MSAAKEELARFPKATIDNLHLVRAIDGQHYIALRDEGGFVDPMHVHTFRDETRDGEITFRCGMTYFLLPLADEKAMAAGPRLQGGIRDEHVMASCKVNDEGALLYLKSRESIMMMLMEQRDQKVSEADAAQNLIDEATQAANAGIDVAGDEDIKQ